jgi:hypothetical protein
MGLLGERLRYVRQLRNFRHHQQHDQAAVSVDGNISLRLLFHARDRFAHSPTFRANFLFAQGPTQKNLYSFANRYLSFKWSIRV